MAERWFSDQELAEMARPTMTVRSAGAQDIDGHERCARR